ncbi:hypothetical protein AKI62_10240 [Streptococcus pneumoniae]|nr:hypothetical protein AKI62_10240 [Streptococcus pneumoniae]
MLLLRKQEREYLRAENAILKKLRELRLKEEKEKEESFIEHKGNYAYRCIHLELRNRAYLVNHKRVQGLIKVLNLQAKMRQKRK